MLISFLYVIESGTGTHTGTNSRRKRHNPINSQRPLQSEHSKGVKYGRMLDSKVSESLSTVHPSELCMLR